MQKFLLTAVALAALSAPASATVFTRTSPTGGALPAAVTEIGGVVIDLTGLNGNRVVTQAPASSLFVGFAGANPFSFGSQSGFTPGVIAALGGGLLGASIRITLFDGDSQAGDFDFNDNTLHIGATFGTAANFGNWSTVSTQETTSNGLTLLSSGTGFGNNILSTGFFSTNNALTLATLFGELAGGTLNFYINDFDPFDNFYDFTQGVDGGLINVGTPPVVVPGIPEPSTWAMMIIGFIGLGYLGQRRMRKTVAA
jgi:hypothetical protein